MENLKTKIENFNEKYQEDFDEYCLKIVDDDLEESKKLIAGYFANVLHPELEKFYAELGGIKTGADFADNFSVTLPTLKTLMVDLSKEGKYNKLVSLGIIDQIMFSWGNDRYEFEEEISVENRDFLNENYLCFGWYRYDQGYESANYLYVDKSGKYGEIFYNQDDFGQLWRDFLKPMLTKSSATENLEDMLCRIIDKLESGINEWEEIE